MLGSRVEPHPHFYAWLCTTQTGLTGNLYYLVLLLSGIFLNFLGWHATKKLDSFTVIKINMLVKHCICFYIQPTLFKQRPS